MDEDTQLERIMSNHLSRKILRGAVLAASLAAPAALADTVLYTSSNAESGNVVIEITQDDSGFLAITGEFPTGGTGTGGGLGNQGAIGL